MVSTLTCDLLASILQRAHLDPSIKVQQYEISAACIEGDNYMSLVNRVTVRGRRRRPCACGGGGIPGSQQMGSELIANGDHQHSKIRSKCVEDTRPRQDSSKEEAAATSVFLSHRAARQSDAPSRQREIADLGHTHCCEYSYFTESVVVKSLPGNPERREMFHSDRVFANEAAAYDHVIPALDEIGEGRGGELPFARCLYSRVRGQLDDVLVLQDLTPSGFRLAERRQGLDWAHARLVARELGRLHARSLAAKVLCPSTLQRARDAVSEVVFCADSLHTFGISIDISLQMAADAIREQSRGEEQLHALADALDSLRTGNHEDHSPSMGRVFMQVSQLLEPREPYAVIQHGDCWTNNLFFKYAPGGQVEDVRLLDLQIMRYSSPLVDLMHFFYSSSGDTDLPNGMHKLIHAYHGALHEALEVLGAASAGPSLAWLHDEASRLGLYALSIGLMLLPVVTLAVEHAPDLENTRKDDFLSPSTVASLAAKLPPQYALKVKELALEFQRQGLLI